MIRVLIVDDHPIVRDGLSALIGTVDGMTVVAEAGDGPSALAAVHTERPDVVLMDLHLPGTSGVEVTREISAKLPNSRVLVLTMSEDDESIVAAIRAGARGYLLKGASEEEILTALRTVAGGGAVFGGAAAERILAEISHPAGGNHPGDAGSSGGGAGRDGVFSGLTNRERDILAQLAAGLSNHAIARSLGLSAKTVANQLSVIYSKLQVTDRAQAMILARDAGLSWGPGRR